MSVERRGGEKRERGPLPSSAWSFACLAHFARWTKKKEILLIVYVCEVELVLCVAIHAIRESLSCRLEKLCSTV